MSARDRTNYGDFVKGLRERFDHDEAMASAAGDNFDAFGLLEKEFLITSGLPPDGYLIDVGCGSGRLTKPLSRCHAGKYLGVDIVPVLVNHAKEIAGRKDWEFKVGGEDFTIPESDTVADMVCFFSVFTHLLHEQSFLYLKDAKRVLKSGGKIAFSFLEFRVEGHWNIFRETVDNIEGVLLNQFIDRDGIRFWASELGLVVESISDGDKPHFEISRPIKMAEGHVMEGQGCLGQSDCVLIKP